MAISVPTFIQLSMMLAIIDDIDSAVSTLTTDRVVHTEQQLVCYCMVFYIHYTLL